MDAQKDGMQPVMSCTEEKTLRDVARGEMSVVSTE